MRLAVAGMAMVVGTAATCGAISSVAAAASSKIPSSAFSDHTGITSKQVTVGNVSTLAIGGLFKGAAVGSEAYADFVNSTGGVNGRKIKVDSGDDGFTGAGNKQLTQADITKDFAMVGSFSLQDSFGGQILAKNPGMPNVSVTLDPATNKLVNTFSPVPLNSGWETGSLTYFKQQDPSGVKKVGTLVANQPSATAAWNGQKAVMQKLGYKIIYDNTFAVTQSDFTANVIAMKNAGVKMLFIEQSPSMYAVPVIKALDAQNFHPTVVLGASTYSNDLISKAGPPSATNGMYLEQNLSLYLGTDKAAIPAVAQFLRWVQVASPGWKPDLFTVYGWLSAELFAQGLKGAGKNPSRGSLLTALSKITSFSGDNLAAPTNPAKKTVGNCYLIGQIQNGQWVRKADPPVTSSTNGYRCDGKYLVVPGAS
jgi:ABC-type branched-subunit amino acid transport system substrate-binding protein